MFLTRIELDPGRRLARKYLGSPQVMHAVVMKAAGSVPTDGAGRVLWRTDHGPTTSLYMLSPTAPDCQQIVAEAGVLGGSAQTLDYEPFLNRLAAGQVWAFRLTANPSRAVPQEPGVRGKRQGHVTVAQQRQWLLDRAERLGFELLGSAPDGRDERMLRVVSRTRPVFGRDNPLSQQRDRVRINQTVFEGVLRVTDPQVLRVALVGGIGRSKAHGCGLMTLARPRS